ncbi:MAG: DUF2807 domain-containing protein, partial [Prevotellaceae bacterium]|nr:DUF2807 domain-containing protein [Prevotellaceae bacterium]
MTIALLILLALLPLGVRAETLTREVSVGDFSSIRVNGSADVTISRGDGGPKVTYTVTRSEAGEVDIHVEGGTLCITFGPFYRQVRGASLHVSVTAQSLSDISLGGSGSVTCLLPLKGEAVSVSVGGSGSVTCKDVVRAKKVRMSVSGSGGLSAPKVEAKGLELRVHGSGSARLGAATSEYVGLTLSGSGDLSVKGIAATRVEASSSGSGSLSVSGEADQAVYTSSGSGGIRAGGLLVKDCSATSSG